MPFLLLALLHPTQCSLTVCSQVCPFVYPPVRHLLSIYTFPPPTHLFAYLPVCQWVPLSDLLPLSLPRSLFASPLAGFLSLGSAHQASGFPFSISRESMAVSPTFDPVTDEPQPSSWEASKLSLTSDFSSLGHTCSCLQAFAPSRYACWRHALSPP